MADAAYGLWPLVVFNTALLTPSVGLNTELPTSCPRRSYLAAAVAHRSERPLPTTFVVADRLALIMVPNSPA